MTAKSKQYVSISISPSVVHVAVTKPSGQVIKVAREQVVSSNFSGALKSALSGIGTVGSNVIFAVPADAATTKNIEVPSTDAAEIESIIDLQANRYTPFSKDEISIGYVTIGSYVPNHTKVLLVIVKREIVKNMMDVLAASGLTADHVSFAPEGAAKFYAKNRSKRGRAPFGIIDIAQDKTNLLISSRGTIVSSRAIPVGIKALLENNESAQAKLLHEIKATIDTYTDDRIDVAPETFVLTNLHKASVQLAGAIKDQLGFVVETDGYANYVKCSKDVRQQLDATFADTSFLDVIAAASNPSKAEVDLLPEEVKLKRTLERKSKQAMMAGVLAMLIVVILGSALIAKVYFKNAFLQKNLIERYADQRQQVLDLEKQIAKTRIAKDFLDKRMVMLDAMEDLYTTIPKTVYLNGVSIAEDGMVSIQGVSDSMSQVFSLVTALENAPMFRAVKTDSTATKKEQGKDVATFQISMKLEGLAQNATPEKSED